MTKLKLNIQLFALTPYNTSAAEIYSQNSTGSGGYRHRVILYYYWHIDPSTRKYTLYARNRFYHQTNTDNWANGSPYNRLLMDGTVMCTTKNNLGSHSSGGTMDLCPSFNGSSWQNMGTYNYSDMGKGSTHSVGISCGYASSWAGISRKTTYHDLTPPDIDPANNVLNSVANFNIDDGFTPNITNYGLSSYMSIANVTTGFDYAVSNGTSCKLETGDKSDIIGLLGNHNYIDLSFTLQTKNGDTQVGTSGPVSARCTVPLTTFTVEKDGSTQGKYNFSRANYGLYDTVTVLYGSHEIIAEQEYTSSITLTTAQLTTVYGYMPSTSEDLTFRFKTYKNSTKAQEYQSTNKSANITMPSYSPTITNLTYSDSVSTYNSKKVNATDIIANLSKPTIVATLSDNYSNSYSSATCNGAAGTISGRTATFTAINQASSYKIKITDNRNKSSETTYNGGAYTDTIKTVPWFAPSISKIAITRPDGPVGARAQVNITGTFYSGSNLTGLSNATLQAQYSYNNSSWSNFTTKTSTSGSFNETYTLSGDSDFYKKPIYVRALITDRIGVAMPNWSNANIPSGQPVFNTFRDASGDSYMRTNGKLIAEGTVAGKQLSGGSGTAGYMHAFTITNTGTYQNQYMQFDILQRSRIGHCEIMFVSSNTSGALTISKISRSGTSEVYYTLNNNVFDLYIKKSESYDNIEILNFQKGYYNNSLKINWVNETVANLPSNYTSINEGGVGALAAYPVGSIYMSVNNVSPATLFGGSWEALPDGYYLYNVTSGAGSTFGSGTSGGTTLTAAQSGLREHNHGMGSHTHTFTSGNAQGTIEAKWRSNKARFPGGSTYSGFVSEWDANQSTYWSSGGGTDKNTVGWIWNIKNHQHAGTTDANASGNTDNVSATNATEAHTHSITPKGYKVYCWKRTG